MALSIMIRHAEKWEATGGCESENLGFSGVPGQSGRNGFAATKSSLPPAISGLFPVIFANKSLIFSQYNVHILSGSQCYSDASRKRDQ
jgi:hypothetical protein